MPRARPRQTTAHTAARPDPAREAWAIVVRLAKAARMKYLAEVDMSFPQAQLLLHLEPDRPSPMSDLATALACDASNITGLVDRLEARKLIERRGDPTDRRVKMVAVTPHGVKVRGEMMDRWLEPPPSVAALSAADKRALLAIMKRAAAP